MYVIIYRQHAINVLSSTKSKNLEDTVILFKKLLHSRILNKIVNYLIDTIGQHFSTFLTSQSPKRVKNKGSHSFIINK